MNQNIKVEAEKGELIIRNKTGDYAIIPTKYRMEVQDMIKDKCFACLDNLVETLPVMEDYAEDGSLYPDEPETNPILTNIYKKYPAFKNMGNLVLKADPTFTKELTGAGDIEFFDTKKLEDNRVKYRTGYSTTNPNENGFGIVYNPENNDEQSIMLDMLHGMTSDKVYAKHRKELQDAFMNSKYKDDFYREWKEYNTETKGDNDGEQQYLDNWIDGHIRNLMFEGSDEDFKKANYFKGARDEYFSDDRIKTTFTQLQDYLKTGEGYVLPTTLLKTE